VIPHSDAAGVVDAVGEGVAPSRTGRRVWVHGAQSYRPPGTAAECTVVPEALAADLPDAGSDEVGANLGIPGPTAHRAVFGDGPVTGATVLVHGVLGGVGALAAQLATWGGATDIGTVRRSGDLGGVPERAVAHAVALDRPDPASAIRDLAPSGVDRIVEVSLSDNADLDAAGAGVGIVIAAYATREDRPSLPFRPVLSDDVTIRLLGQRRLPGRRQAAGRRRPHHPAPSLWLASPVSEASRVVRAPPRGRSGEPSRGAQRCRSAHGSSAA
jgi:NADPH2:quinone reductase